jgi:hypothetical protein
VHEYTTKDCFKKVGYLTIQKNHLLISILVIWVIPARLWSIIHSFCILSHSCYIFYVTFYFMLNLQHENMRQTQHKRKIFLVFQICMDLNIHVFLVKTWDEMNSAFLVFFHFVIVTSLLRLHRHCKIPHHL